ncbi:winged helix-turn-helix domain-containing protein [Pseudonocardia sp. DSM 110487]|uniref:BTAD domain-containing putative transcriptional regulator n=1 Tax=Pseudonocardia sp. DSM 110487 TaxID=2865833 RepID=UPI001C697336|nr:BTAD domain-containing putative transcriptional regulator [Pseudonocardia sp. DSM 110487]QYN37583.1 winged helix-turn-helix domain-containing protein [Pseudonocardia sp. DSM 110487]
MSVRVEVLGPLRLVVDGVPVDVPGPKRRAVLALLALAEGRIVTIDHLRDALWPFEVPESGRQALHTHISRLRAHLGTAAARLQTRHDGYRLDLTADELDVAQARALLAKARTNHDAFAALREAHGLWRGPVLADLTDVAPIATAVDGCAQLQRDVTDALIAAGIAAGRGAEVCGLAAEALAADPLREPAVLLLMRALAAAGRAAAALHTAREFRRRLADETGLDPSPALGELERDIAGGSAGPAPTRPDAPARPTTRLIGRDDEVAALERTLPGERLVTIVGPGGVGKTRVALEVAGRSDASTVLLLAPVNDPGAIPHALAAALNLNVVRGDVLTACVSVLAHRAGLLVIDNCEHLVDAIRDTVEVLLAGCPDLRILATSRERLGLAAEYTFRLAPLPLPGSDRDLSHVPSVAVFLDRAARVRPGPAPTPAELRTVADIVRRLDGMPLAIELAAGRLSTFSLTDLHRRLDRSLDLLGGSRPTADARHRTLRATVEWSYDLLTDDERRLFRQLSVFVDGVDLETAERIGTEMGLRPDPGTALAHLVDASMIDVAFEGATRYRMLETLRAYGLDRLAEAGEDEVAGERFVRWAVELADWIGTVMSTEREPDADTVLRRDLPNLRAAWRLARSRGRLDDATAMVTALYEAMSYRDLIELRGWAEELADDPAIAAHPNAAAVLGTAAEAAYLRGDHPRVERLARAGLERATDDAGRWFCLIPLAWAALARGAYAEVVERCLAATALPRRASEALGGAALASVYAGDDDTARVLIERGRGGATSPSERAWIAYVSGEIESRTGHNDLAERHYLSAIELARRSGATFLVGVATVGLLTVRAGAGRIGDALRGYREVIDYFARTGNWTHLWATLRDLAGLLRALGDDEPAALLVAAAADAPDAPAAVPPPPLVPGTPVLDRAEVLEVARRAIERNLQAVANDSAPTHAV